MGGFQEVFLKQPVHFEDINDGGERIWQDFFMQFCALH